MENDKLCIKEDVCDMAICDGVSICSHAVLKTAVLAQQTNNSRVMQLPTLEEVLKHVYCGPNRDSSHTASVVSSAYDFIVSRQQS
jgi:hypothetical protein